MEHTDTVLLIVAGDDGRAGAMLLGPAERDTSTDKRDDVYHETQPNEVALPGLWHRSADDGSRTLFSPSHIFSHVPRTF